jgi:hypothetical protein
MSSACQFRLILTASSAVESTVINLRVCRWQKGSIQWIITPKLMQPVLRNWLPHVTLLDQQDSTPEANP